MTHARRRSWRVRLPEHDVLFRWALASVACFGIAMTAPLWTEWRTYPLAPVLPWLPTEPRPYEWLLLPALLGSMLLFGLTASRRAGMTFLAVAVLAVVTDVNRFQPWLFQYALFLGAMLVSPRDFRGHWRLILACTYLWSGVAKLNPSFATSFFPELVSPFLDLTPPTEATVVLALAAALAEAVLGVGLLTRRWGPYAAWGAIAMHAFILLCIGPLGHDGNHVVWPWNIFMIAVCLWMLRSPFERFSLGMPRPARIYNLLLIAFVGVLPALSIADRWDSYPSFALYSGNSDRAEIAIGDARPIALRNWAEDDLLSPPYPEAWAYRSVLRHACERGLPATLTIHAKWTPFGTATTRTETCGSGGKEI